MRKASADGKHLKLLPLIAPKDHMKGILQEGIEAQEEGTVETITCMILMLINVVF